MHLYSEAVHADDLTPTLSAFQEALPQSSCTDLMRSENVTCGLALPTHSHIHVVQTRTLQVEQGG